MDRAAFRERFVAAAAEARDFAREYIEEELPDAMRFRLHLNSSYDKTASSEFELFPDDSSWARTLETKDIDADGVVDVLWREGYVPQWVDVQVASEDGLVTVVNVVACGRFTNNEARLYYSNTPIAPFSPKGPWLPARHVDGQRFSIYDRSACWSVADLVRVGGHADKVWSLALHGPAFSDAALASGPVFPRLEILELYGVSLDGEGLAGLDRFPPETPQGAPG